MSQLTLPKVEIERSVNGLEMGVLSNGTSYLNGRSLARICGVAASAIIHQANRWSSGDRDHRLAQLMASAGVSGDLFIPIEREGKINHAYPDHICMVFLEYYAFEARTPNVDALRNFRLLARAGLRAFVYNALGYSPTGVPDQWRQFHDRVSLVSAPVGYFSIFKESSDFVVAAIRGGLTVDEKTVPDISIGLTWAKHWTDNELERQYGERRKFEHNYPEYFPQAASNPQPMWVYPVSSLPAFRVWLQTTYVAQKLPNYLDGKVRKGILPASVAELLLAEVTAPELPA
jgi:hypothetical protein